MGLLNPEKDIKGQKHILAYITPGEADTLQDLGAEEVLTSEGIPAYPPLGEEGTSPGTRSDYSPGQGHRETYGGPPGITTAPTHVPTPSQPSGPDPHDWVVDPYGNIALEQEKIDVYEEPTQANLLDLYMQYGAIPNAFRWGKAGLEKLGELGSGLQEKAMTWSLENRLKSIQKQKDFHPGAYGYKISDIQSDIEGIEDGTFTQTDFTEKYGSGDVSDQGGGDGERQLQNLLTPYASYAVANQTPVESQVDKWFASNQAGTGLDPNYMNTYNTAKAQIANTLGMVDTSNQFGYSDNLYGGLTAQNLATNPYNIDWMQQRGLI
jgi:hypothetical protein